MNHFFITSGQINNNLITVTGSDVRHINNVLRMKTGDEATFSDGVNPVTYHGILTEINNESVCFELIYAQETNHELPVKVYLFQSLPKSDKMELIIQKAVELGIHEIIPISTSRSVVRLDDKKALAKVKRWQTVSEAAAKQCKRDLIPNIHDVMTFARAITYASDMDIKIIPYEMAEDFTKTRRIIENINPGQSIAVFIGPEGGFSRAEIETAGKAGFSPITIGKRILRTETAALVILSWIMYLFEG